ncbi:MAG: proline--tRNA ligase [Dehalococcoidia bacterium]|nr:proline--tRNA ligase [Dehalococcoidia bacterium]
MRYSKLFGKTLREVSGEVETVSHRLMIKGGMIHPLAAGLYTYMPLAQRALHRIERIIREEMDRIGGQEIQMPALQPLELWQETGRDELMGDTLMRLQDRRGRDLVLGPTHEEVVTDLARRFVRSYRDLPTLVYQIQIKFRDEPRPRGGLLRVREFAMKDMYTFDADDETATRTYKEVVEAYRRIYLRCGLEAMAVEADSGAIGGKESHEFMVIAPSGENDVIYCPSCGYAANAERAESRVPSSAVGPAMPLEKIATPGVKKIEDLAAFLHVPASRTWKAVFYMADKKLVLAAIRGDLEVNEIKLKNRLKALDLRSATDEEIRASGLEPGFASPIGVTQATVVLDGSLGVGSSFAAGANQEGYHYVNAELARDLDGETVDIALAQAGHACARCGAELRSTRGIEVGHTFKLGTVYSQKMGATYLDSEGNERPLVMGCFGIGVGRLLASAIEQHHDDKGVIWPVAIAPYQVYLCPLGMDNPAVSQAAEELYERLTEDGIEVLYDDRAESPGVKMNDADLLGMPLRVVVSPRSLKSGSMEIKPRGEKQQTMAPIGEGTATIKEMLARHSSPVSPV